MARHLPGPLLCSSGLGYAIDPCYHWCMTTTRVSRRVNAPRPEVYGALIDATAVQHWMVPDGMTSRIHAFEGREGGAFRISLTYEGAGAGKTSADTDTFHGRFVRLVPDELVVEVVEFETDDPAMRGEQTITISLADIAGGTEIVAVHARLFQAGNIYTSSGFSAGIDLALAWVAEDLGSAVAVEAARELVLFLRRPAGQTQLSVTLAAQAGEMRPIQELQVWIADNLARDLSTVALAGRVSMSVRNFGRRFTADVGTTPARYVRHLRVEAARRLLQSSPHDLGRVARTAGFGTVDGMRRAFVRVLGKSPRELRGADGRR